MTKLLIATIALAALVPVAAAQDGDSIDKIAETWKGFGADDRIENSEREQISARCAALAEAKQGKVGFDAVLWTFHVNWVGEGDPADKAKDRGRAMDVLIAHYPTSSRVAEVMSQFGGATSDAEGKEFFGYYQRIFDVAKNQGVRAVALAGKAQVYLARADNGAVLSPEERVDLTVIIETLETDYAEVPHPASQPDRPVKIADLVAELRGALANLDVVVHPAKALEIGAIAPDIVANDIDGVEFKLSDYRGKVVVLDFWGDW